MILYVFKLLRGKTCNVKFLGLVSLCFPDRYVERRRRPQLLAMLTCELLTSALLNRTLSFLNMITGQIVIEFTQRALIVEALVIRRWRDNLNVVFDD